MLIGEDSYGNVVCDGGRELAEPDRAELERFAAMLRAWANGKSREEAYELVYGVEAPQTDKEA